MKKRGGVWVKVVYISEDLQKLVGKREEAIEMPVGSRSGDFIDLLQERYPEIFDKYGPGYLGFDLNGKRPHVLNLLKKGDCYRFITWTEKEVTYNKLAKQFEKRGAVMKLPKEELKMPKWMECTWRRIACGKQDCPVCGRIARDRQRHIEKGEDPDSMESVFEDVGRNFKEVLQMLKKDAELLEIDITNIENIEEPPKPEKFPLYQKVKRWHNSVYAIANSPTVGFWVKTEEAQDLLWYSNTLLVKTYRQLCNRWHIKNGDDYGDFDHQYTKGVLKECLKILKKSLQKIIKGGGSSLPQKKELGLILLNLSKLEKEIIKI